MKYESPTIFFYKLVDQVIIPMEDEDEFDEWYEKVGKESLVVETTPIIKMIGGKARTKYKVVTKFTGKDTRKYRDTGRPPLFRTIVKEILRNDDNEVCGEKTVSITRYTNWGKAFEGHWEVAHKYGLPGVGATKADLVEQEGRVPHAIHLYKKVLKYTKEEDEVKLRRWHRRLGGVTNKMTESELDEYIELTKKYV